MLAWARAAAALGTGKHAALPVISRVAVRRSTLVAAPGTRVSTRPAGSNLGSASASPLQLTRDCPRASAPAALSGVRGFSSGGQGWKSGDWKSGGSEEPQVFAPPSPFFKNVECVRETEILAEQQPS